MEATESPADADLFARIAAGDTEAFARFYDRHGRLLFGIALKIIGSPHEAEDILQDACVTFWERAPQYDSRLGTPLSWVVALTRNKAIDRLRLLRRKTDLAESAATEAAVHRDSPAPDDSTQTLAAGEDAAMVRAALETLSPDQREALHLGFFCGLTHAEIAGRLNQPLGTVKARIRRGMLTLRDALEGRL